MGIFASIKILSQLTLGIKLATMQSHTSHAVILGRTMKFLSFLLLAVAVSAQYDPNTDKQVKQ